jgi:hypothetical protein
MRDSPSDEEPCSGIPAKALRISTATAIGTFLLEKWSDWASRPIDGLFGKMLKAMVPNSRSGSFWIRAWGHTKPKRAMWMATAILILWANSGGLFRQWEQRPKPRGLSGESYDFAQAMKRPKGGVAEDAVAR